MNKPLHPDPNPSPGARRAQNLSAAVLAAVALAYQAPVPAVQFEAGDFAGSFDNTISYGATWRVQGRDKDILGLASTTLPNGTV
ncbi:MAG TPA: DUF1302 family protein, partial [Arenicellales bacterium]|nr:DUF1302 family protein [Arenicellales bacterium]